MRSLDPAHAPNYGLARACNLHEPFAFQQQCRTGATPHLLVWGDSFAMQLVDGVAASTSDTIAQATRAVCAPFLGIAPVDGGEHPLVWALWCEALNRSVIAELAHAPQLRTVVLSSYPNMFPGQKPVGKSIMPTVARLARRI